MITIKADKKSQLDQEKLHYYSKEYLSSTDWYVTRKHETGKEIPQDVVVKRQEARDALSQPLIAIDNVVEIKIKKTPLKLVPLKKEVIEEAPIVETVSEEVPVTSKKVKTKKATTTI